MSALPATAGMTDREWVGVYALLKATWPAAKLPAETAAAWYPQLARFPAQTVRNAVLRLALEQDWAPTEAQLYAACQPPKRHPSTTTDVCDCSNPACVCVCTHGWTLETVTYPDPRHGTYATAVPCRRCRPAAHRLWEAGHWSCPNRTRCPTCKEITANGVS